MNKKLFVILVSFSLFLTACSFTNILDRALEFLPQVEEALPEMMEALPDIEDFVPFDQEQEPAEAEPMDQVLDDLIIDTDETSLDITVTERTMVLESDDPLYEIEIRYPYMEGVSEAISPFNNEMDYLVEVVLEVFLREVEESDAQRPADAMAAASFLEIDYEITYQSDGLFSVYVPITTYIAISPNPWMDSFSYNYDAHHQEFLMPGDFFMSDAAYFPAILNLVETELATRDIGYQEGAAEEVLLRRDNWNFLSEGLRYNFDAYEVTPGAAGLQFVIIPWEELSGILDLDGPAGRILQD